MFFLLLSHLSLRPQTGWRPFCSCRNSYHKDTIFRQLCQGVINLRPLWDKLLTSCRFCSYPRRKASVPLSPGSLRHVKSPKAVKRLGAFSELAAGEGFEPSHTESESAVLPLHKPAVSLWNSYYYTKKIRLVKGVSEFFPNFFFGEKSVPSPLPSGGGVVL